MCFGGGLTQRSTHSSCSPPGKFTDVCLEAGCSLTPTLPDGPTPPLLPRDQELPRRLDQQQELKVSPKNLGDHIVGIKMGRRKTTAVQIET